MRVLVLGGDGYLGWPTAMHFAAKGHQVMAIDNYLRRRIAQETGSEALIPAPNLVDRATMFREASGHEIAVRIGDCADYRFLSRAFAEFKPDVAIHYAEQPSAPY
jgi:UDP-sulfoquinovose synthase